MKIKIATAVCLVFAGICASAQILPYGNPQGDSGRAWTREYRQALKLFENGMYDRSMLLFQDIAMRTGDVDAYGYYVLNAVSLRVPGYEKLIEEFIGRSQSSTLIPQIRYRYALNLFDDKDFKAASEQFEQLSRHQLYRKQVPEFQFKRAYCDFELRYFDRALLRFTDLTMRAHSDYTAPAQYAAGYICYEQEKFADAAGWLEKASKDSRFTEIASFYLVECRFMLKEYEAVRKHGPEILASAAVLVMKLASDIVISIVDGLTDRERNIRMRMADYRSRLHKALALYGKLEELFPEKNVIAMLDRSNVLPRTLKAIDPRLWLDMVINALDLMYFWYYQPRASYALGLFLKRFSRSERLVLLRMQQILMLEREVSQLLVDGLVGRNFAAPLSFYLARNEEYLRQMKAACLPSEEGKKGSAAEGQA